jgi:hypothetical protein
VALAAYFVWYEGYRNSVKLLAFICACIAAHRAAGLITLPLWIVFASMSSDTIEMPIYFGWGSVGAFIVLAAGIFLFSPRSITRKSLAVVSLWSLGGSVLGAIAVVPYAARSKYLWFFPPLVWQPGTATLLGLLLERERRAVPKPSPAANS